LRLGARKWLRRKNVQIVDLAAPKKASFLVPSGAAIPNGITASELLEHALEELLAAERFSSKSGCNQNEADGSTPSRIRIFFDAPIQACYYAALSCLINCFNC
jgi:hypothetical protein